MRGQCQPAGFVIKELSPVVSSFRADRSLHGYLKAAGIMGLAGVDTRALTKHLRTFGAKNGVMSTEIADDNELVRRARTIPSMNGLDLCPLVAPKADNLAKIEKVLVSLGLIPVHAAN